MLKPRRGRGVRRAGGLVLLLVVAACTRDSESEPTASSNPTTPTLQVSVPVASATPGSSATELNRVRISLWHCGIEPLRYGGELWEVPNREEPFDGTNAPASVKLAGTIERVGANELRYVDDSSLTMRFVPDNGSEPICA